MLLPPSRWCAGIITEKWDSYGASGSSNIFFPINQYVIDVRNLSPFFFFLALPAFPQQRASVDLYYRKGGRQPFFWHVLQLRAVPDIQVLEER
jgi:hypothetical protein